jgi:hypothetical protein
LLGLLLPMSLLGSPVNADIFTYNVDFATTTELATIAGTIVTTCDDNCVLLPANIISWSFTLNGSNGMSSTDGIGTVSVWASHPDVSPLTATASGIVFNPLTSPSGSFIGFGNCNTPNFSGEPCLVFEAETYFSIHYDLNSIPGMVPGVVYAVADSDLQSQIEIATTPVGVPVPIVGAGFPGLVAGGGFLAWWRRKRKAKAAA